MTKSESHLVNSCEFMTLCIVRTTGVSKAAGRQLSTPFWFAVSVLSTTLPTASSTITGVPVTASQIRTCSPVRNATGSFLVFADLSSKTIWSATIWIIDSREWASLLSFSSNAASFSVICLVPTRATEDVFRLFNFGIDCDTPKPGILVRHDWLGGFIADGDRASDERTVFSLIWKHFLAERPAVRQM